MQVRLQTKPFGGSSTAFNAIRSCDKIDAAIIAAGTAAVETLDAASRARFGVGAKHLPFIAQFELSTERRKARQAANSRPRPRPKSLARKRRAELTATCQTVRSSHRIGGRRAPHPFFTHRQAPTRDLPGEQLAAFAERAALLL
jgi:hypothetical protein